jgi:hypothetical protein
MITINLDKAKVKAHSIRRLQRLEEFLPLDKIVTTQIPGQIESAEAARQVIREKYAVIQTQIDEASSVTELHQILDVQ